MLNIAIDGYVGSGKSTLARSIAKKLGLKVLDTGAIYRSITCLYKEKFGNIVSSDLIEELIKDIDIKIDFIGSNQIVLVNGINYSNKIRQEEISILTSQLSTYLSIRNKVLSVQRRFAEQYNCVIEGRDIGTVVLPKADFKFFITASEQTRAERRYAQIKNKQHVSFEQILQDLQIRDFNDANRKISPLAMAKDAILIDTTDLTLDQTVEKCLSFIKKPKNKKHL